MPFGSYSVSAVLNVCHGLACGLWAAGSQPGYDRNKTRSNHRALDQLAPGKATVRLAKQLGARVEAVSQSRTRTCNQRSEYLIASRVDIANSHDARRGDNDKWTVAHWYGPLRTGVPFARP